MGRALSDAVHRNGRVLLVGSQQRSNKAFRRACELVRNGFIGELMILQGAFAVNRVWAYWAVLGI